MMIFLGSDHGGYVLKEEIQDYLQKYEDVKHLDMGCFNENAVDYPDIAKDVCKEVLQKDAYGILVCGTGIGMSMAANKIDGIRAALCHNEYEARMAVKHNHANVLCLGGRVTGDELAKLIVQTFIHTEREQEERHQRRIRKIMDLQ